VTVFAIVPLLVGCTQMPIEIAASRTYLCARFEREVTCRAIDGERPPEPRPIETDEPTVAVSKIEADTSFACGLGAEGEALCWGTSVTGAHQPPADGRYSDLDVGADCSCGLDITTSKMECWGNTEKIDPVPTDAFVDISTDSNVACGITPDRRVVCSGEHTKDVPADLPPVVELHAEGTRACVTDAEGRIRCWGYEERGVTPTGTGYHHVVLGQWHACALDAQGEATCWGVPNGYGLTDAPAGAFVDLAAGHSFTCGVRPSGAIECWGCEEEAIRQTSLTPAGCAW
jgi:hypothetical protein